MSEEFRDRPTRDLIEAVIDGDEPAAAELLARIRPLLREAGDEDAAQQAAADLFLALLAGRVRIDQTADLHGLVRTIARRAAAKTHRRKRAAKRDRRRTERLTNDPADGSESDDLPGLDALRLVVAGLSDDDRDLIRRRLRGDAVESIAADRGIDPRTARRRLQTLRQRIDPATVPTSLSWRELRSRAWRSDELLIERMIGAGRLGRVFRTRIKGTDQFVATKFLRRAATIDAAAVEQFRNEAAAVDRIDDPHVVGYRGLGRTPRGGLFLVMDLMGPSLADQPPTADRLDADVDDITRGLRAVHAAGLVHGDLKPANLLRGPCGVALTDFGQSHLIGEPTRLGGTLAFLAPEQLDRSRGAITPAADAYALGMLIAHWLGCDPLSDDPRKAMRQILSDDAVPIVGAGRWFDRARTLTQKRPEGRAAI